MTAYLRRKRWEADLQAAATLEMQIMMADRVQPPARGLCVTADGERIRRVSTREGLAMMTHRRKI